jgi:hypothetical protein
MSNVSMIAVPKLAKHRRTCAPFECTHCGVIWYGSSGGAAWLPDGVVLCVYCWNAVYDYLFFYDLDLSKENERVQQEYAAQWIANKNKKPYPRHPARKFAHSVPGWMRSAIDAGMVKTNGSETYVVYSQGQKAMKAEVV